MKNNELDNILDKVTDAIRAEQISDDLVSQSANRVWQRVSTEAGAPQMSANTAAAEIDRIEGCADFQSLIPGYLGGKLSEARSLLLESLSMLRDLSHLHVGGPPDAPNE